MTNDRKMCSHSQARSGFFKGLTRNIFFFLPERKPSKVISNSNLVKPHKQELNFCNAEYQHGRDYLWHWACRLGSGNPSRPNI